MQAVQRHPAASRLAPARLVREPQSSIPVGEPAIGNQSSLPWLDRWTERFVERLVAWGDGATHRRLGSWSRYD
jgi:hypothetical protein